MEENTETAQVCRKKERYFSRFSGEKKPSQVDVEIVR